MPSREVGAWQRTSVARSCIPWSRLRSHRPSAVIHSPGETAATTPTTGTRSRRPFTFTLSTAKPVSSLWKVTRSTRPDSPSTGAEFSEAIAPILPAADPPGQAGGFFLPTGSLGRYYDRLFHESWSPS